MYVSRHVTHPQPFDGISKKSLALLWIVGFAMGAMLTGICTVIGKLHNHFPGITMWKNIAITDNASQVFPYIPMLVKLI